jgi:lysophospholipase L1-like esterase
MKLFTKYILIIGLLAQSLTAYNFSDIQTLIANSRDHKTKDVTYIVVGDSTRAISRHKGEYIYYQLKDTLDGYQVTTKLFAKAGHMAEEFNHESASPTWREVANSIKGDGSNTIVDICLGINDLWDGKENTLKSNIRSAIYKIQDKKPNTIFILTMPNRIINDVEYTEILRSVYIDLSNELDMPLNNIIDDLMPTPQETDISWYRDDGFNVHLSRSGQALVANYILENILPDEAIQAPINPSDLYFTDIKTDSVTLNWSDNSDNETGFKIYRDGVLIFTTGENITSFKDVGLSSSRTYNYTIKATN